MAIYTTRPIALDYAKILTSAADRCDTLVAHQESPTAVSYGAENHFGDVNNDPFLATDREEFQKRKKRWVKDVKNKSRGMKEPII